MKGLVLGGGGITGISWELGLIKGLSERGVDLRDADTVLGTSAGSVVGTLLLSKTLDEIFEAKDMLADPRMGGQFSVPGMMRLAPAMVAPAGHRQRRARIGQEMIRTRPSGALERVALIREGLDVLDWPDHDLRITATNIETGAVEVFSRDSGVDIVHAVAASCAVPFVFPAVTINDTPYMDGGIRSPTNADFLTGYDRVLVLAPLSVPLARYHHVRTQLDRGGAAYKKVVQPDPAARRAMGRRVLDTRKVHASAEAGEIQGREIAERIGEFWLAD